MPKRKRDGSESPDVEEQGQDNQQVSLRTRRVEAKLVHGQKLLARAFKTARGFERQKLGRRRKTAAARSDAKDVARIDAETAALKTLDLNKAATNYLNKSLLKFKTVAESPALPKSVLKPAQVPQDTATLNVVARLCSANPTKEALPDILRDIQLALGIQVSKDVGKGKGKVKTKEHLDKAQSRKAVKPEEESENSEEETDDLEDVPLPKKRARETRENEDEDEEASDADSGEEEVAYAAFDARIAGSDDEDEGEEDEEEQDPMAISSDEDTYTRLNKRASPPVSPSPSPTPSRSPSASPEPSTKVKTKSKPMAKPTSSAFVPSLIMGGYWSGSESEPEDDIDVAPKKNRRGQRARQAIAEKKYGNKAKHLQKEGNGKGDRNKGWDAKRGATDGGRPGARGGRGGRGGMVDARGGRGGGGGRVGERGQPEQKKRHRDDEGALHPSWQAAKKAKDAKAVAPFQGKKITFD